METELNLIKAMLDVAFYEKNVAENTNTEIVFIAESIFREKVLEIAKVLKNPSKFDKDIHRDLIE